MNMGVGRNLKAMELPGDTGLEGQDRADLLGSLTYFLFLFVHLLVEEERKIVLPEEVVFNIEVCLGCYYGGFRDKVHLFVVYGNFF
ncbi:hypothetical protein CEXT_443931 [Caerostris extrusa]|uniref:Uncharacterized protein n=1 Tax=Caerostris extrusa TaxID=172846 RepID=A0AAV4VCG9_CAEEX|nr:hypothetical protein CEXT_443931 [Caerostris extrusa]